MLRLSMVNCERCWDAVREIYVDAVLSLPPVVRTSHLIRCALSATALLDVKVMLLRQKRATVERMSRSSVVQYLCHHQPQLFLCGSRQLWRCSRRFMMLSMDL